MITLTLMEAVNISAALSKLPKLRLKCAQRLMLIRSYLKPHVATYIELERGLIADLGGKIQPDGQSIAWPTPKLGEEAPDELYRKQRQEALATEIEIPLEPVKFGEILGADGREPDIEPEMLFILEKIIVE